MDDEIDKASEKIRDTVDAMNDAALTINVLTDKVLRLEDALKNISECNHEGFTPDYYAQTVLECEKEIYG